MTSFSNYNSFQDFPYALLIQIFSHLDVKSICSCSLVSKKIRNTIDTHLWRYLSLRDYTHFLVSDPITEEELEYPIKASDIKTITEDRDEANRTITDPFQKPFSIQEQNRLNQAINRLKDWKSFFVNCYNLPNLNGYWVGDYGGHGYELIRIYHKGYKIYAKKLTGDENIPAGKLTWRMTFGEDMREGKGEIHLAERGFMVSRWSTAYLYVIDKNFIRITWFVEAASGDWYCVSFANVKAGCREFDTLKMGDRIQPYPLEDE